jgi:Ser/Thr protein kinase RdoA (MazF antagonist)
LTPVQVPLFARDLFSSADPTYVAARAQDARDVTFVLAAHIGRPTVRDARVRQCGGIEVNSNNFLVEAGGLRVVVKRVARTGGGREYFDRQLAISNLLAGRGVPSPRFLPNDAGELAITVDDRLYCVSEFVPGRYFSGTGAEVRCTAEAIASLLSEISTVPSELAVPFSFTLPDAGDLELLDRVERERGQWGALFGAHEALLETAMPQVRARLEHVSRIDRSGWRTGMCHYDLHPHNVLVDRERVVSFLDVDSFVTAPLQVPGGFGAFKLLRQSVVATRATAPSQTASLRTEFLAGLAACEELLDLSPEAMASGAEIEILRRLLLILWLNLEANDSAWNHVLPVQIAALSEVDQIFRR